MKMRGNKEKIAAGLEVPPEPGVEQQGRRDGVAVIDGEILYAHVVSARIKRKNVDLLDLRRLFEQGVEVASAELMLPAVVIDLRHKLVLFRDGAAAPVGQLVAGTVGRRNVLQEVDG